MYRMLTTSILPSFHSSHSKELNNFNNYSLQISAGALRLFSGRVFLKDFRVLPTLTRHFYLPTRKNSTMSINSSQNEDLVLAKRIFEAGVDAAIPSKAIRNRVTVKDSILRISDENSTPLELNLEDYRKCHVVGFGKAVLPMAEELLSIITNKVEKCILSVPAGTRNSENSQIEMYTGAKNNIPDSDALFAAGKICQLAKSCSPEDLLIVLISGGGSALLPLPKAPITLEEKSSVIKKLSRAGASIFELNTIRKRISVLKGGGLVKVCPAKRIVSLILSDVLNDPLDIIASGPTVQNPDDPQTAVEILNKYLNPDDIPPSIIPVLMSHSKARKDDENEAKCFEKVTNVIIGNNKIALKAAATCASQNNLKASILTSTLEGEAKNLGKLICEVALKIDSWRRATTTADSDVRNLFQQLKIAKETQNEFFSSGKEAESICLLLGGEPTVNVSGSGTGGRNQELALASAIALYQNLQTNTQNAPRITVLSAGTDGIDGPCEAAGAVVNCSTVSEAKAQNINATSYLQNNDSFNFFKSLSEGKFHVITGHTGTNVMDLIVVIIRIL